ncbi:hypothetical protein L6R29_16475 [Myxococcota bacterium]|nr:hypothetical protein [Myxococcota bacterium]
MAVTKLHPIGLILFSASASTDRRRLFSRFLGALIGLGLIWAWGAGCFISPIDTRCRPCAGQIACGEAFLCIAGRCQPREQEPIDCTTWESPVSDAAESVLPHDTDAHDTERDG